MKKPARTYVIEQDEHLQNLRKIIKRDFFGSSTPAQQQDTINLTLNSYISNYKSNENQFFSEMVETNNEEWRKNHWWIDKQDKMLMIANSEKFDSLPYHNMIQHDPKINGINTSITKQDAKNSFFFNREKNYGSLQAQEYEESKKVVYSNCKLDDPYNRMKEILGVKVEEKTPRRQDGKAWEKDDVEEKKDEILGSPQAEEDGHLMTWGEIQSTPMRIAGPEFKMPQTPQRQVLLNNLNHKITKEKLQPSKKSEYVMKLLGSITPSLNSRLVSKNRYDSSLRRAADSVNRTEAKKSEKAEISGLLNIKK